MNIGLDLDFTITAKPEFFAEFTKLFHKAGHNVFVITYRDSKDEAIKDLIDLNITYKDVFVPRENEEAHEWKAQMARELKLDIMIDDAPEVIAAISEDTTCLWLADKSVFNMEKFVDGLRD